uniref:DUF302 domain-containing protein n=1 Tax=Thaumasiovibrio occultus TaxID=1891184 RepID=UPI000B361DFF|nr:DUF302 domain-containing protein [Thaumasiovibrio occultus]
MKHAMSIMLLLLSFSVYGSAGVMRILSQFDGPQTAERLNTILLENGLTVFAQVPHSNGAASVDVPLNYATLFIFGDPRIGAPLMACQPNVAIDLPQKMLVSEDANGDVWLSYNNPLFIKQRHRIEGCDELLNKIAKALRGIAEKAASDPAE